MQSLCEWNDMYNAVFQCHAHRFSVILCNRTPLPDQRMVTMVTEMMKFFFPSGYGYHAFDLLK